MDPPQVPADEDVTQPVGQTSINQLGAQSRSSLDQKKPKLDMDDWENQRSWGDYLQPEFQDSNMSPALPLLHGNAGAEHNYTEYSLFQHSDNEFAPLRGYPDVSMASEAFHCPAQDLTSGSLSQQPLAQATVLSEEGASSYCSLSQHSLSPADKDRQNETAHSPLITTTDKHKMASRKYAGIGGKDSEDDDDETFFLSKNIPARDLMKILQEDVGMASTSSSSAFSSETSVKSAVSLTEESKSAKVCKAPNIDQSTVRREGPPGEASLPRQQKQESDKSSYLDQSQRRISEVGNITMGIRSTQPDDSSESLRRQLRYEVERRNSLQAESESKNRPQKTPTPPGQFLTPYPTAKSEGNPASVARTNVSGVPWTGQFSAGVEPGFRGQNLWNQTGIEGSYLGFLPQSQSTPGVFKAPPKSSVKAKLGGLSPIESSYQSNTKISPQQAFPLTNVLRQGTANQSQEEAKVHSLPILSYMEKVESWRANQSSNKTPVFDSLALQGFSGVSPKKKAYDAVSDTLNRLLSQHASSLQQQQTSVSTSATNQNEAQSVSTVPHGSFTKRGEAVGSAPSDKDNSGPTARQSQSQTSINTVVAATQKDQLMEKPAKEEQVQTQLDVHQKQRATVQPTPRMSLGLFCDFSLDTTISSSEGSKDSGMKLAASVGASSVMSLEVDNYAPYWTSKVSTPPPPAPRPRELNIDERIPLYLQNLGIDQSPSTILTPFATRGPIREPEFSPTDLCTIKGSIGTPTKSTQPSEGGSPHKVELSRYSVMSVDSSVSIPFSMDSLGPNAASIPYRPRRASPPSDTKAVQSQHKMASSSLPYPSTQKTNLQQQQHGDGIQNTIQLATKATKCLDMESPIMNRSMEQIAETSFVSSQALLEIRSLLVQAENMASTGSSSSSAFSSAAPRLPSEDDNIFLSMKKKSSSFTDSLFSSSSSFAAGDSRSRSSLPWARSSSDSMLLLEKLRDKSIGREGMTSSQQPNTTTNNPSTVKQALITTPATATYTRQPDNTVSRDAGPFVLSQSARRAEPEGCSAAPPDNAVITPQQPVTNPSPAFTSAEGDSTPTDIAGSIEEETQTILEGPVESSGSVSSPSPVLEDSDQAVMSDGSSGSSLAVRVAKLLQTESPATMVSSTSSFIDLEESKAREWLKLKISGQQCEPLELDKEDRRRIEEIKRELLLKNPMKSQLSTDTESSAASSVRIPRREDLLQKTETFTAVSDANKQPSQPLHGLSTNLPGSSAPPLNPPYQDLEAQIREIAVREGVTLPRTNLQALTSITIATRRRSNSPSPSTSPAPAMLHLTELSTVDHAKTDRQLTSTMNKEYKTSTDQASVFEPSTSLYSRNQNLILQSTPANQKRQDAVGGHFEKSPPPSQGLDREEVNAQVNNSQAFKPDYELLVQDSAISGVGHETEQAASSSTSESPPSIGHVSHVHLTLSPKIADHSYGNTDAGTQLPRKEFGPLRRSPVASSPDEGVGLSSPPEWYERVPDRVDTSTLFKPAVTQGTMTSSSQLFTPVNRGVVVSPRTTTTETPAVPVLLPYKPRGSEELFYVPQTEADVSSSHPSDTTMESTHTGSDDAVPPRFSSDVLGHKDPGLDRGVTTRHTEGIYSKRLKTDTFKMNQPAHRGASVSANKTSQTNGNKSSSHVSVAFTSVTSSTNRKASTRRDQGTSPVHFQRYDQPGPSRERSRPVNVNMDPNNVSHQRDESTVPPRVGGERGQERRDPNSNPQPHSSTLDQLWGRFCDEWSVAESRPTNGRDATLLERLERLSRIIHNANTSEASGRPGERRGRRGKGASRDRDAEKKVDGPVRRSAWTQNLQEHSQPADDDDDGDSNWSSVSDNSSHSPHLESETVSTMSGSMSTIDTARLVRAFGAHRVQHLKSNSGLSKLYSAIDKQKEGKGHRRGIRQETLHFVTMSETTNTDESTVTADSASSTSTYTFPSHHGRSKKPVRLLNKGIQAGALEFVRNGTRRHTRDVGTTFPSPAPSKTQGSRKQRRSKKVPPKTYPEGVSWFVSADDMKSEARKENEESSQQPSSTTWFEPYSKVPREPLRQRQVHEEENTQSGDIHQAEPELDPTTKTIPSGLARITLQEALLMRRPDFVSESKQRVRRLERQTEERKLQDMFSRAKEQLYSPLPRHAGPAVLLRAVPRKEMIQRSKQIYDSLPEVQRRREEERRKAEYRSYRLNAQLFNKRITNHIHGRRTAWQ